MDNPVDIRESAERDSGWKLKKERAGDCAPNGQAEDREQLVLAMELAGLATWEYDFASSRFLFNDSFFAMHGTSRDREGGYSMSLKRFMRDFLPPGGEFPLLDLLVPGMADSDGGARTFETCFLRRDGESRKVLVRCKVLRDGDGRAVKVVGATQDVTVRRSAEAAHFNADSLLLEILESMPSAIIVLDGQSRVAHWSKGAERLCGTDAQAAMGSNISEVCPVLEDYLAELPRDLGSVFRMEKQPVLLGDDTRLLDIVAYPLFTAGPAAKVLRLDDVTRKVRLEEMMVQHAKMLSVGTLAAGMAHEINNPLAGVLHALQNVKRRIMDDLPANRRVAEEAGLSFEALTEYAERRQIGELLDAVRRSGERAASIVRNMLGFIRKAPSEFTEVSLPALLDRAVEIAATDYDLKRNFDFRRILIERDYQEDMPLIPCAQSEMEQVLLNLLGNAAQAMARNLARTRPPRLILRVRREGGAAVIEVEDNGPGMDEAVLGKIFDPFYTTKPPGEGTGLGLAVSYFIIVSNHKGRLNVDSTPGKGARFVIRLPLPPGTAH